MFGTLRGSLYAVGVVGAMSLLAVLLCALWSFGSLGSSAAAAQRAKAIVADVLPPPLYLVETRLLLSQAVEGTLSIGEARARIKRLQEQNTLQHAMWSKDVPTALKPLLSGAVATTAEQLFAAAHQLLESVERGDAGETRRHLGRVQQIYEQHRAAVDGAVVVGDRLADQAVDDFQRTRQAGLVILVGLTLLFMIVATVAYGKALRGILGPVSQCVSLAHRIAAGDLVRPAPALRDDEIGQLQDALAEMTEQLGRDRASLVQAKDASEAAARAKADFLANMSHEIRTPMNAVLGLTSIVLRGSLTARQRDYLEKAHGAGHMLLRIINDVLDVSKIHAGKMTIESVPFRLDSVFDELAAALNLQMGAKPIELIVQRDDAVPNAAMGDPTRLKQVLLNLASNAIKFTHQGEVCIAVSMATQGRAHFSVRDTGIGLEEAARQRIFQAFEQADSSTTRQHGGTGLGLTISQQLVALMGGAIEVTSEAGKGSTFSFEIDLPAAAAGSLADGSDAERDPVAVRNMLSGAHALVVDDNFTARLTLASVLRSFGMTVTEAENGRQALTAARTAELNGVTFAAALVDWRMPDIDGFTVIEELRKLASMDRACYIIVSAYEREHLEEALQRHGTPDGVLQKPVTPSTLLDTLYSVLLPQVPATSTEPGRAAVPNTVRLEGCVLLVEDNEINQLVGAELLSALGLQVLVADDGLQALEQASQRPFDAVVMDLQMPGMDGFATTAALRKLAAYAHVPIIAMTANCLEGERERCLRQGMNDYISKPVDPEALSACMSRWLPKHLG